jgi:hypothetical protein
MRKTAFAAALATISMLAEADAASCRFLPFRFFIAADAATSMNVESGKDCSVRIPSGGSFMLESNRITTSPGHGGARPNGVESTFYRSYPGYRGKDAFAFTLCGSDNGKPGCATVRVRVYVR